MSAARRRAFFGMVALGVAIMAAAGALCGYAAAHLVRVPRVEELATYRPDIITEIRARDGSIIARFAVERRILVPSSAIAPILKRAIVDTEDKNFYRHGGIDFVRLVGAAAKDFLRRRYAQGASTLTQQLARAVFLTPEKNFSRKLNEAFLAVDIERRFSKEQILTFYCNQIGLGHGNYGVEAAARYYFGRHAAELDLGEAALLAGLIQRPATYSPFRNPDKAVARRHYVLTRMLEERDITPAQMAAADAKAVPAAPSELATVRGPYFCEEIRQYLEKTYGDKELYRRGLKIDSTLDPKIQGFAEESLRWGLRQIEKTHGFRKARNIVESERADPDTYQDPSWTSPSASDSAEVAVVVSATRRGASVRIGDNRMTLGESVFSWTGQPGIPRNLHRGDLLAVSQEKDARGRVTTVAEPLPRAEGAVLILDNATGAVLAMVGGYDWSTSKFNRAVQALRQTGSSFKPFVYMTALENGYTPAQRLFDGPLSIEIDPKQPPYRPHNYHNDYAGIVTMRRALEHSINIPAVRMAQMVGLAHIVDTAHRFGISEQLLAYPSLALGAFETTLWEMTSAYSAIAEGGLLIPPYMISRVSDPEGTVLEENRSEGREVAAAAPTFQLLWMLKGVCVRGTAARTQELKLDNIAGKTGTTNEYTDAWFLGFTPKYTIGVWVGNDEKKVPLGSNMDGARAALPIWMRIVRGMKDAGLIDPKATFEVPPHISFDPVDYNTGLKATPATPHPILEAFAVGSQPSEEWSSRWEGVMSLPWALQEGFYHEGSVTPQTPR